MLTFSVCSSTARSDRKIFAWKNSVQWGLVAPVTWKILGPDECPDVKPASVETENGIRS